MQINDEKYDGVSDVDKAKNINYPGTSFKN
jgi:hypothetical protein